MTETIIAYFGHHKSGSTWITNIMNDVARTLSLKCETYSNPRMFNGDLARTIRERNIDLLCYTNADYQHVIPLNRIRGFHVVRDPRDIIVSAYFSHLHSHESGDWLDAHRNKLKAVSKDEGIFAEMEFVRWHLERMDEWDYSASAVLELHFEDLIEAPQQVFETICLNLQLVGTEQNTVPGEANRALSPDQLKTIVEQHNFARKTGGRPRGHEDYFSHYRKGVAGDWVNHFTDEHIAEFKRSYNSLLIKLGYEDSEGWERPQCG